MYDALVAFDVGVGEWCARSGHPRPSPRRLPRVPPFAPSSLGVATWITLRQISSPQAPDLHKNISHWVWHPTSPRPSSSPLVYASSSAPSSQLPVPWPPLGLLLTSEHGHGSEYTGRTDAISGRSRAFPDALRTLCLYGADTIIRKGNANGPEVTLSESRLLPYSWRASPTT